MLSVGLISGLFIFLVSTELDAEKRLAYVGGGALWGTVDSATIEHGLAVVGGTVSHVRPLITFYSHLITFTLRLVLLGTFSLLFDESSERSIVSRLVVALAFFPDQGLAGT